MSHESHLGLTCGAVTAQKKKAGVGLLLNSGLSTYIGYSQHGFRARALAMVLRRVLIFVILSVASLTNLIAW